MCDFLKHAELPVRYIGLKLVRKMKTLRYKSGHDSYIGATNKVIKEGDLTGKELQAEKRVKQNPKISYKLRSSPKIKGASTKEIKVI